MAGFFTARAPDIAVAAAAAVSRRVPHTVGLCDWVGYNQRERAHRKVARTKIADERKAVSILEVANRDHIAIESWNCQGGQCRVDRAAGDVTGIALRRVVRALVPVQLARTGLGTRAERIGRGISDGQPSIKALDVDHVRIQKYRTTYIDL